MAIIELAKNKPVNEGASRRLYATLKDDAGNLVQAADITKLEVTLKDVTQSPFTAINGRTDQNVLNANGGSFFDTLQTATVNGKQISFNFFLQLGAADFPIFDQTRAQERHRLLLVLETSSGAAEPQPIDILVQNVAFI